MINVLESDGEIIDEKSMAKAEKALGLIGIKTREIKDGIVSLKPTSQVLSELAKKFEDGAISAEQMSIILNDVGGKRQGDILAGMIQNWGVFSKVMQDYTNSAGSAAKEAQKDTESWAGKLNILSNAWTGFVAKTVDTEWIKGLLDAGTSLLKLFDNLGTALTLLAGLFLVFKREAAAKVFESMLTSIPKLIAETKALATGQAVANASMGAGAVQATALGTALNSVLGVLGLIMTAYSLVTMAINGYNQAQKEQMQAATAAGNAALDRAKGLQDLKKEYQDVLDSTEDEITKTDRLNTIKLTLADTYGVEKDALDKLNGSREDGIDLLDKEAQKALEAAVAASAAQYEKAQQIMLKPVDVKTTGVTRIFSEDDVKIGQDVQEMLKKNGVAVSQYSLEVADTNGQLQDLRTTLERTAKDQIEEKERLNTIISYLSQKNDLNAAEAGILAEAISQNEKLNKTYEETSNALQTGARAAAELRVNTEAQAAGAITSQAAFDKFAETLRKSAKNSVELEYINQAIARNFPQYTNAVEDNTDAQKDNAKTTGDTKEAAEAAAAEMKKLGDAFTKAADQVATLSDIQEKFKKSGKIDSSSLKTLISLYPEAIAFADDFGKTQEFVSQKIAEQKDIAVKTYAEIALANRDSINDIINSSSSLPGALATYYGADYNNFVNFSNGKYSVEAQTVANLSALWAKYAAMSREQIKSTITALTSTQNAVSRAGASGATAAISASLGTMVNELKTVDAMYDAMEKKATALAGSVSKVSGGGGGSKKSGSGSSKEKEEKPKDYSDITEELIRQYNAEYERLKIEEEILENNKDLLENYKNSSTYIALENKQLENQAKQMETLVSANTKLYNEFNKIVQANKKYDIGSWFDAKYEATVAYKKLLNSVSAKEQEIIEDLFKRAQGFGQAIQANSTVINDIKDKMAAARQEQFERQKESQKKALEAQKKSIEDGLKAEQDAIKKKLKAEQDAVKARLKSDQEAAKARLKAEQDSAKNRIKALEKEKDLYRAMIDARKELLALEESKRGYEKDVSDKEREMNKTQSRIQELSLDTSREANAERLKLEEELAKQTDDLGKLQRDRYVDLANDRYDKEYAAFEANINRQIEGINDYLDQVEESINNYLDRIQDEADRYLDMIESQSEAYLDRIEQDANARIDSIERQIDDVTNATEMAYGTAIDWNTKYGKEILTLANSWETVLAALDKYRDALGNLNIAAAKAGLSEELGIPQEMLTGAGWDQAATYVSGGSSSGKSSSPASSSKSSTSSSGGSSSYTVKKGDTLSAIAKKYGTTVAKIMAANPSIKNADKIYEGQKITIPSKHIGAKAGFVGKSLNPESESFKNLLAGAMVGGEQLNLLKDGELVVNADQMKGFMNNTLPSITTNNTNNQPSIQIGNLLTVQGNVTQDTMPELKELVQQAADMTINKITRTFKANGMRGGIGSALFTK